MLLLIVLINKGIKKKKTIKKINKKIPKQKKRTKKKDKCIYKQNIKMTINSMNFKAVIHCLKTFS